MSLGKCFFVVVIHKCCSASFHWLRRDTEAAFKISSGLLIYWPLGLSNSLLFLIIISTNIWYQTHTPHRSEKNVYNTNKPHLPESNANVDKINLI